MGRVDVWSLLEQRARTGTDRPFVEWHPWEGAGRTWTYGELAAAAAAVAAGLQRRGVRPGDRILVHLDNCPEFLVAWFACAAAGAVAVTTNTRSAGEELGWFAADAEVVGAITQPRLAGLVARHAPHLGWLAVIDHDSGVEPGPATRPAATERLAAMAGDPADLVATPSPSGAPMSVMYTSGTTARPKGVVWTHANARWAARVGATHQDLRADDCHLAYMPLFHTNALAMSMLASLWVGARFVLVPKWSTSRFWDVSLQHGCTWLSLMALSTRAINGLEAPPHHSYRRFGAGVCDLPFDERLGVRTIGWWGMTEVVSQPIVGDPFGPNRPWSMGRTAPEYRVAVVREDGRTPVEAEEPGELLVLGTPGWSIFAGYLGRPDLTAAAFDDRGWFHTGDRVVPHADGYFSFVERAVDALRVGAENVAASEVERVVLRTPGVVEAAVVGRPDPKLDEVPVAFVVAGGDRTGLAERVLAGCRDGLADFKVPREVHVVAELPRSTLHKVDRVALRRLAGAPGGLRPDALAAAERSWLAAAAADPSGDAP